MKARQSKEAKIIFSDECYGRAILREIHNASAKNAHVITDVNIGKERFRVKEL